MFLNLYLLVQCQYLLIFSQKKLNISVIFLMFL